MKPVISLVGRPNVGKSTLFNCLTKSRDAIVADYPGLTRDRKYGNGKIEDRQFIVVDTGGLTDDPEKIDLLIAEQVKQAIEESDHVFFVVDARDGLTAADEAIAAQLRRFDKTVHVVVNKVDGIDQRYATSDFYALGLGETWPIAAGQGRGVSAMITEILPAYKGMDETDEESGVRIAVIGRPNVGKSTLVNRVLGEERVVAADLPGTTRDTIDIPFEKDGQRFMLLDTAGIRRRGKVTEAIEKFSVIKAMQAINDAHIVFFVLDASERITDQDLSLLGQVIEQGRAVVLCVNKWDGLSNYEREQIKTQIDLKLGFMEFADLHYISALHGTGVGVLLSAARKAYDSAMAKFSSNQLTELLATAVMKHSPPIVRGRRVKPRYAHQGGKNPPLIVIHGNQVDALPDSYKRYLSHFFRKQLKLHGTPVRMQFNASDDNPFKDRKNKLTDRQVSKRRRMMKHVKGRK